MAVSVGVATIVGCDGGVFLLLFDLFIILLIIATALDDISHLDIATGILLVFHLHILYRGGYWLLIGGHLLVSFLKRGLLCTGSGAGSS